MNPWGGIQRSALAAMQTFFRVPATVTQLTRILELCRQYQVRTYLLGNGSNTLFSDAGFGGAVICLTGLNSHFSMQAQPDG